MISSKNIISNMNFDSVYEAIDDITVDWLVEASPINTPTSFEYNFEISVNKDKCLWGTCGLGQSIGSNPYYWLFDGLRGCKKYGCTTETNMDSYYWIGKDYSSDVYAYVMTYAGKITKLDTRSENAGVRVTIRVPKNYL